MKIRILAVFPLLLVLAWADQVQAQTPDQCKALFTLVAVGQNAEIRQLASQQWHAQCEFLETINSNNALDGNIWQKLPSQVKDILVKEIAEAAASGYVEGFKMAKDHPDQSVSDIQATAKKVNGISVDALVKRLDHLYDDPKNSSICIATAFGISQVDEMFPSLGDEKMIEAGRTNHEDCEEEQPAKPTLDKQTCAKIAARPDPFAQFGGISNDNAICKEAYPDLYQPHR